ncbi:MAG: ABC transporter ATP-binding protein [Acidobacteriota bacterium]
MSSNSNSPVAHLQGAVKQYGRVTALDGVDFATHGGEVVALLGPNGAGKTTLVGLLLGLLSPDAGTAELFGRRPNSLAARRRVGAMLQISGVPETLRVEEHIRLFSSYYPRPLPLTEVLALAGLEELRRRPFGKLSGGERQRLLFALAICGNPDLLFLDEPTVGLDVASRRALWERIAQFAREGRSVILTTHYLEEADALADRVLVLDRGRIRAAGTSQEIKAQVGGKTIRCHTHLDDGTLRALPGVQRLQRTAEPHDPRVELTVQNAEQTLRALLERDPDLSHLEVRSAALEDAFLALLEGREEKAA